MKNILIFFDGTGNEPSDGQQDREWFGFGELEDSSISNILKMHLLFGGDLDNSNNDGDQPGFYYSGVGTYGGKIKRTINALFGFQNLDVDRIQQQAFEDLCAVYQPGDALFIFGFSRGAAIARQFCARHVSKITSPEHPKPVRFLGVFDTVASIGKPNLDDQELPISDVVFENQRISDTIQEALHLVALDDKRKAFLPTLMNREDRVTEIWFAGAHSDIGGGFRRDGLSDITLQFMLDKIRELDCGLELRSPRDIRYEQLTLADTRDENEDEADAPIDFADVMMNPNPFGHLHQQSRPYFTSKATLCDRPLHVFDNDAPCDALPIIHHSACERIYGDPEYKPLSLYRVPHRVLMADGELAEFRGLQAHRELGRPPLIQLQPGESKRVRVYANQLFNRSGILMSVGERYSFEVDENQQWHDSGIKTNVRGWRVDDEDIDLGWFTEILIKRKREDRRVPEANWFELCASLGEAENRDNFFQILHYLDRDGRQLRPKINAEFRPFANDLLDRYGNNLGFIDMQVKRIS